jgi:mono/diheme cytochrome c family protein
MEGRSSAWATESSPELKRSRLMRELKLLGVFAALGIAFSAGSLMAYQAYMTKAKKFGAEDCLFCHVQENGGVGWNERGDWLIQEKAKRKAEKIDVDWLVDYNPDEEDGSKKPPAEEKSEKKPGFTIF